MKIDHIAMYVKDLEAAKYFFMKYFQASPGERYQNAKTGFESYFLSFSDNCRLEIMKKPNLKDLGDTLVHFGYAHVAFSVGSIEKVDSLTSQLKEDGFSVISGPRITVYGYYESCILALDGNLIEITV